MTIKKTATLIAAAALAVPAAALAHHGPPGKGDKAAKHAAKTQAHCDKGAGFNVRGTGLEAGALTFADGKLDGTLVLDVGKANHGARTFLGITTLPAADQKLTLTGDAVKLRFDDVNGFADVKPTDQVRIDGRLSKAAKPGCPATTPTLDVRKVTVRR